MLTIMLEGAIPACYHMINLDIFKLAALYLHSITHFISITQTCKFNIKTVFVKQTGSGWDRRQATLQILVHADGIQRCKPLLIFYGKNQDHTQKPKVGNLKQEYNLYDSRVEVMFNLKAWSNADLMVEWIKHIYTPLTNYPCFPRNSIQRPPRFISLDIFAGQKTKEVIDSFKSIRCTTLFIPGGTTGFIQVCDTVINRSLKTRIEELADQYIDKHEAE
jgi:hypothetical protein